MPSRQALSTSWVSELFRRHLVDLSVRNLIYEPQVAVARCYAGNPSLASPSPVVNVPLSPR